MVRTTRHGPVLSDVLPAGVADPGYALALSATFLLLQDRSAQALWEASHATNWAKFREALRNFVGPVQNTVYADDTGTIGFIAPGLVPIRKKGDGRMPAPGWTGEYDWNGFIPFDKLPSAVDPSSGRFVSANNKIVPNSYPYFISRDWDLPDRAERINTLLDATPVQELRRRVRQSGRYPVADGQMLGAADDPNRARRSDRRPGTRIVAAVGFPHGPRQDDALAVHRLAAAIQPRHPLWPLWQCCGRILGSAARSHESSAD